MQPDRPQLGLGQLGSLAPAYLNWALKLSQNNPNFNEAVFSPHGHDYNYQMAFLNDPSAQLASNGHLSDIGKMPNHPTFSNESVYAIGRHDAGDWKAPLTESGDWQYYNPSRGLMFSNEDAAYKKQTLGQNMYSVLNGKPGGGYGLPRI